ncbi:hypothetical protein QBC39DRAFT_340627 [Podospora conica]|nr:hypothetical protein QBC39DRAFT_340627 [Schizothecium conicum]
MGPRRDSLSPPSPRPRIEDPGAHDLETSDSEEHFSDAISGTSESHRTSPIPKTRVERVDDKPAYGEVPGTAAYNMREEDAAPDEIAYVPENKEAMETPKSPTPPGGKPIPVTVVEESPDVEGSVTHPEILERHGSDPHPDVIVKADKTVVIDGDASDTPISPTLKTPTSARARRKSSFAQRRSPLSPNFPGPRSPAFPGGDEDEDEGDDGDDFGDDFDDFEEGDDDGDFGDFDEDGFQEPEQAAPAPAASTPTPTPAAPQPTALSFPIPDFTDLSASSVLSLTEPYLSALFPHEDDLPPPLPQLASKDNPIFFTPRSAPLWSQLVAPPPLQPPDWIRSRIRRAFLVSLGVPIDLDEILPASKQKKLVLPSLHRVTSTGSLRRRDSSSDSRGAARGPRRPSVDDQGNLKPSSGSRPRTASPGSKGGSSKRKDAAATAVPDGKLAFDLTAARQLCTTTDEALSGMTDAELKAHVARLEAMRGTVGEVLEYWQKRADEKIGDREAFEGVIENLVKHARKVRK